MNVLVKTALCGLALVAVTAQAQTTHMVTVGNNFFQPQ